MLTKVLGQFNVDDIQEPNWDDRAYEKLVLPEGEKDIITAFADRTRRNKQGFDDFVQNKGNAPSAFNQTNTTIYHY